MFGRMHAMRRLFGAMAVTILSLTGLITLTPAAHADRDCATGGHCYSIGIYTNPDLIGVRAQIRRDWLSVEPSLAGAGSHVNSEFWFILDNNEYLEAGSRATGDTGPTLFWADHVYINGQDTEYRHDIGSYTPDRSTLDYWRIVRDPTAYHWDIQHSLAPNDPTTVGVSTVEHSWNATEVDMGGEWAGYVCNGSAMWGQQTSMWVTYQTWSGWWNAPFNNSYVSSGCTDSGNSPTTGQWNWSLN